MLCMIIKRRIERLVKIRKITIILFNVIGIILGRTSVISILFIFDNVLFVYTIIQITQNSH